MELDEKGLTRLVIIIRLILKEEITTQGGGGTESQNDSHQVRIY